MSLEKEFLDIVKCNTQFMERISAGIEAINHSNELHRRALDENRKAIEVNSQVSAEVAVQVKAILSLFRWVLIALVTTVIAIAGGEKVLQLLPRL